MSNATKEPLTLRKAITFLVGAGATGLIYVGGLFLFNNVLKWNSILSVSIAYTAAMVFYFIVNKKVVFKSDNSKTSTQQQVVRFTIMCIINYGLTLLLVMGFQHFTHEVYSGSIAAGIVTTLLAYLVFDRMF